MDTNQQNQQNQNQQTAQSGESGQAARQQPGQAESRTGQSSQDNRQGDPGRQAGGQAQQGGQGARDVLPVAQQGRQAAQTPSRAALLPPVDIFEDETGFVLIADMPGVAKEQLVVRVTGDNLLIEGAASVPAVAGNMELVYGEVQALQYRRSFTLSRELDPGKIEAKLANGVLTLRIPKAEEARPRRIEISAG